MDHNNNTAATFIKWFVIAGIAIAIFVFVGLILKHYAII